MSVNDECGCITEKYETDVWGIVFCPLHEEAQNLQDALRETLDYLGLRREDAALAGFDHTHAGEQEVIDEAFKTLDRSEGR